MTLRHSEKHKCYTQPKIDCEANGWKVQALCVEVGFRGHMSQSFDWMCKGSGLTKEVRKEVKHEVERTVLHCSHAIVAGRRQKGMDTHATAGRIQLELRPSEILGSNKTLLIALVYGQDR